MPTVKEVIATLRDKYEEDALILPAWWDAPTVQGMLKCSPDRANEVLEGLDWGTGLDWSPINEQVADWARGMDEGGDA